jgi:hypothetical protein
MVDRERESYELLSSVKHVLQFLLATTLTIDALRKATTATTMASTLSEKMTSWLWNGYI